MNPAHSTSPRTRPAADNATRAATGTPSWHALAPAEALQALDTDPVQGLSGAQAADRLHRHGRNSLPEPPPVAAWRRLLRQFLSPLVALLSAAAALALLLDHTADAVVILVVVLVNALIGHFQEGRAERSMAALRQLSALQVRVRRNGQEQRVPARDLVPGDILLLAAGDAVGADARLLESSQLQAAEAALTGESLPVDKHAGACAPDTGLADRHAMLHAGTHISAGRAVALVVATGATTEVGRIAELTHGAHEPATPLERHLQRFGRQLVLAALGLCALVLLLGLWRGMPLQQVLMVAISQMVSMVPEGLPVALTIALAVGMQRMAARGAIIRRLSAVETLGSITTICSDKTGTLTRNEMTVAALWLPDGRGITVEGTGYRPEGCVRTDDGRILTAGSDAALERLLRAAALCNDAELRPPEHPDGTWTLHGDPTEGALLVLAVKAGLDLAHERRAAPREAEWPFDATRQLMATRHRLGPQAPHRVWLKGAPEVLLRLLPAHESALREAARAAAEAMAGRALRVLAAAEIDDEALPPGGQPQRLAGRLRLLGLIGQIDPPREEARAAVAACRSAGIRPVMITGDHALTGLAIARALDIARDGDQAVDGRSLEAMDDAQLRTALPRTAVFARVQPAQKLRIVQALQATGAVVAMTGDGVNDAPALARADVGVAMGITGTEVAKSAAKVVLTDDRFDTLVAAVEQGRVVHGNLRKLLLYLLSTSLAEVAVLLAALLTGLPVPLAAVQILWINLVTEGTVTVNLAMEPPDGDELHQPPRAADAPLLDRGWLMRAALLIPLMAGLCFGWYAWRLDTGAAHAQVRTETFTLLAMCAWFNVLNCQSATASAFGPRLWRNRWLAAGLGLSVALQAAVLYGPALGRLLHTQPLGAGDLLRLLAVASLLLWAEEARKAAWRWRHVRATRPATPPRADNRAA